jgi:hypothetical protein
MALLPPAGASAFFATDSPVLRWYLRALTPAVKADGAAAIVGGVEPASLYEAQGLTTYEFELSDVWHPAWRSLSPVAALHYLLRARVWTPLESHRVTIAVRPNIPVAPTVIFAPVEPPPAGSAAPPAPSAPAESSTPTTPESAPSGSPADNPASDPSGNPGADTPGNGPG